jgi:hypothetical protein
MRTSVKSREPRTLILSRVYFLMSILFLASLSVKKRLGPFVTYSPSSLSNGDNWQEELRKDDFTTRDEVLCITLFFGRCLCHD